MEKIIVPVDFSKYSEYALKAAALLAKKYGAEITLVHMLELSQSYSDHDSSYGQSLVFMIKFAEKQMEEFIKKPYLQGLNCNVIIKHFKVFSEIGSLAEDSATDLIVMGSHGTTEVEDYVLGSNTEKVVRNSDVPVLIIKDEIEDVNFENPVFVSNFKLESVSAYRKAMALYNVLGIKPKLLFVNKPDGGFVSTSEMNYRFETFLLKAEGHLKNVDLFVNYDDYTVEKGVYYYCKENNIDIISIATHGKSNLSKFFNKSISLDIANHSVLPVLTVRI